MKNPLVLIWAALLMSSFCFVGVAWFLGPGIRSPDLPELFVWVTLGLAAVNVVLSRALPRVLKGNGQARAIVGFALAESAVLLSGVAWMLTSDLRAAGGVALGLVALASLFPREAQKDGETIRLMP